MQDQAQIDADAKARVQLGELLEGARRDSKLQRNQVSVLVGVSNTVLSDVENGDRWPEEALWDELSKLYGLPIDMMAGMKRTALNGPRKHAIALNPPSLAKSDTNVVMLDEYRKQPWQPTTTLNPD